MAGQLDPLIAPVLVRLDEGAEGVDHAADLAPAVPLQGVRIEGKAREFDEARQGLIHFIRMPDSLGK